MGKKAKLHDSNLIRSENSNEVEKEHNTTKSPNDNMFNQTPRKVLKLIQANDSESTSSENEESSDYSINSGSRFHFNLDGSIVIENIVLGDHSSFEKTSNKSKSTE